MDQIAANIGTAAKMLGLGRTAFYQMRPALKANGMRQCGNLIDLESLKSAWQQMCSEAAGDVRRTRKAGSHEAVR